MDALITPGRLAGVIPAVASKSMAHRLMILAALADEPCTLRCDTTSADIEATQSCLEALLDAPGNDTSVLDCGESGSTLRFLLPMVGALGAEARMRMHGRLAMRPLAPFDDELRSHGMDIERDGDELLVSGQLTPGRFVLPGNVSSQYVSGLLLAAPLLDGPVEVWVRKPVASRPYISLTIRALEQFGVTVTSEGIAQNDISYERFGVKGDTISAPPEVVVEGDWSNAAFWLAAGSMETEGITVTGLDLQSPQGDRAILAALAAFGARIARKGDAARATADLPRAASMGVGAIPDLVPPLAAIAATAPGTTCLRNAGRLRLKESDRLASVSSAINALGGDAHVSDDELVITGVEQLRSGTVDACNDHRIAMMAAVMATHATGPVTVQGAECVAKSYPTFWDDYARLGGNVRLAGEEL